MEPRLPALTVEERIIEQLTKAENDARAARSKAFEKAAEMADNKSVEMHKELRNCFCHIHVEVLADSYRALAKGDASSPPQEQADE